MIFDEHYMLTVSVSATKLGKVVIGFERVSDPYTLGEKRLVDSIAMEVSGALELADHLRKNARVAERIGKITVAPPKWKPRWPRWFG